MSNPTEVAPVAILVATLPVSDLAASASFYSRLFGLELLREFAAHGQVTGCSLSASGLPYALNLRRRSTLRAGDADLRGEHPIIWLVADDQALEKFREHAATLGLDPAWRRHDDANLICVVDPDGHDVLVGLPVRAWTEFKGYELTAQGYLATYDHPRLSAASV